MYPAVVLAGGLGKRLRSLTGKYPKYFLKLFNYPLVTYPINSLLMLGIKKFIIVIADPYLNDLKKIINEYLCDEAEVEYVVNHYPHGENGYSLLLSIEHVPEPYFFLSVADHIYSPKVAGKILDDYHDEIDILVGGDSKPNFVNVDEATKIITGENGKLLKIGKRLRYYTHVDIGLFIMKKEVIRKYIHLRKNKKLSLSKLIYKIAMETNNVYVTDVNGGLWTDVDTVSDVQEILNGKRRRIVSEVIEEINIYVGGSGR